MGFAHYDLGNLSSGQTVVVTLGNAANVLLLDDNNFRNYRNRQGYNYRGGYVTRSPYRVGVPNHGHWHLVIDLGGRAGTIRSSVEVF